MSENYDANLISSFCSKLYLFTKTINKEISTVTVYSRLSEPRFTESPG